MVRRIDVSPQEQVLTDPANQVRLHVTAEFSDGRTRDVTGLSVFEPSNLAARVDRDGIVHLRGEVENGTSDCIFQLPAGYRPPFGLGFPSVSQNTTTIIAVRINIDTDGQVCLTNGFGNVIDTLEGIQFRTDS